MPHPYKFLFRDYADYEAWETKPKLPPPSEPLNIPEEWAGHIIIALHKCVACSEDEVDLDAMETIAATLLRQFPHLRDQIDWLGLIDDEEGYDMPGPESG
jgi:hypothetical protein